MDKKGNLFNAQLKLYSVKGVIYETENYETGDYVGFDYPNHILGLYYIRVVG
jgi:hypothetical protein